MCQMEFLSLEILLSIESLGHTRLRNLCVSKKMPYNAVMQQHQSQFTPKMKANADSRLLSSLVWIDQDNECNKLTAIIIFAEMHFLLISENVFLFFFMKKNEFDWISSFTNFMINHVYGYSFLGQRNVMTTNLLCLWKNTMKLSAEFEKKVVWVETVIICFEAYPNCNLAIFAV